MEPVAVEQSSPLTVAGTAPDLHRLPSSPLLSGMAPSRGGPDAPSAAACQSARHPLDAPFAIDPAGRQPAMTRINTHEDRHPPRLSHHQGADDRRHRI